MRVPQDIIKRPLLTEKNTRMTETGGSDYEFGEDEEYARKYVFEVAKDANKIEVRQAVEKLFGVRVSSIRTQIQRGKKKRVGRYIGRRPSRKKAIITLIAGDAIELFEGV